MRSNINLYSNRSKKLLSNKKKKNEETKSRNNNQEEDVEDDEEEEENENDDEEVRLDELLDAMELTADEQNNEIIENEGVILSADEAATIPSIQLEIVSNEFTSSEITSKEYNFL